MRHGIAAARECETLRHPEGMLRMQCVKREKDVQSHQGQRKKGRMFEVEKQMCNVLWDKDAHIKEERVTLRPFKPKDEPVFSFCKSGKQCETL